MQSQVQILGIRFDNLSMTEVLEKFEEFILAGTPHYAVSLNTHNLMRTLTNQKQPFLADHSLIDQEYKSIVDSADLVFADGMPVIWASRFLSTPLKERVPCTDLLPALCYLSAQKGYKLYFLGERPGVAEKAKKKFEETYPGVSIVGAYSPSPEEVSSPTPNFIDKIKIVRPDILCVFLGVPKQEKWIKRHYLDLRVPVCVGMGAALKYAFDEFWRVPKWMQRIGLEWIGRLIQEPQRHIKTYFIDDSRFFILILKERIKRRKKDLI